GDKQLGTGPDIGSPEMLFEVSPEARGQAWDALVDQPGLFGRFGDSNQVIDIADNECVADCNGRSHLADDRSGLVAGCERGVAGEAARQAINDLWLLGSEVHPLMWIGLIII